MLFLKRKFAVLKFISREKSSPDELENHGHIISIGVKYIAQNSAIACQFMSLIHNNMKTLLNIKKSNLNVRCNNTKAFKMYNEKFHYEILKTDLNYYEDGVDAYVMELNLENIR